MDPLRETGAWSRRYSQNHFQLDAIKSPLSSVNLHSGKLFPRLLFRCRLKKKLELISLDWSMILCFGGNCCRKTTLENRMFIKITMKWCYCLKITIYGPGGNINPLYLDILEADSFPGKWPCYFPSLVFSLFLFIKDIRVYPHSNICRLFLRCKFF